jgi:hypothetical protein
MGGMKNEHCGRCCTDDTGYYNHHRDCAAYEEGMSMVKYILTYGLIYMVLRGIARAIFGH